MLCKTYGRYFLFIHVDILLLNLSYLKRDLQNNFQLRLRRHKEKQQLPNETEKLSERSDIYNSNILTFLSPLCNYIIYWSLVEHILKLKYWDYPKVSYNLLLLKM